MPQGIRRSTLLGVLLLALVAPGCSSNRDYIGVGRPGWSLGPDGTRVKEKDGKEKRDKKENKAKGKKQGKGKGKGRRGGE